MKNLTKLTCFFPPVTCLDHVRPKHGQCLAKQMKEHRANAIFSTFFFIFHFHSQLQKRSPSSTPSTRMFNLRYTTLCSIRLCTIQFDLTCRCNYSPQNLSKKINPTWSYISAVLLVYTFCTDYLHK